MSKIKSGGNNPNAKLVLNLETGIFYDSTMDAAISINMKNPKYLAIMLSGRKRNKTQFIYV